MILKRIVLTLILVVAAVFADPLPHCLRFDGQNHYVHINNSNLNLNTRFTLESWIHIEDFIDGAAIIDNGMESGEGIFSGYGIFTADSNRIVIRLGDGIQDGFLQIDSIPENVWQHFAVTYDRFRNDNNLIAYLNGNIVGRADCRINLSYPGSPATYGPHLGRYHSGSGTAYFKGMLDDVRIWNIDRTKQQIRDNMSSPPDSTISTLRAYYTFNEGSGNVLSDRSLSANHGNLVNMSDSCWQLSYAHLMTTPSNDIGFRRIVLSWTFSKEYTSYTVDLSEDPEFTSSLSGFPVEDLPAPYYVLQDIEPGTYYYRVKGHYDDRDTGSEPWSDIRSVSTTTDAATPIVLSDFDAVFENDHVRISWQTASQTEHAAFLLQRKEADREEWCTINRQEGAGTVYTEMNYEHTDRHIAPGKQYEYRLCSISYASEIEHSDLIRVGIPELAYTNLSAFRLDTPYPNPFNPRIAIPLSIPYREKIDLRIIGLNGQCLEVLYNGILGSGAHTFFWEPQDLPSGIYLIRLSAGEHKKTAKILYLK